MPLPTSFGLLHFVLLCLIVVSWKSAFFLMGNGSEENLVKRRGGAEVGGVEGRETVVEMYY